MQFYSTNNKSHKVSLEEAVVRGLAPDGGLYMPETITPFPAENIETLPQKSFQQIGFEVAKQLLGNEVPADILQRIVNHTITFDAPLVQLESNIFSLELFHGPTLAFKDFGARFMSQLLTHFAEKSNREVTVLVATSGDTGSAVANGFLGVPNTKVVVLYPSGKVSDIQEKQFTTLGKNITALEINGTFDDCQRMVKQAFSESELQQKLFLTSANSINIARLIPQSFYYFYAWSRLKDRSNVVVSVPSGNFGNLTAGLLAKRLGLPIQYFIASTNANDIVPQYLTTKQFNSRPSIATISNAMDVGNPSNFARMLDLYGGDWNKLSVEINGYTFSDDETRTQMRETYLKNNYTLDPHGAVGLLGLKKFLAHDPSKTGFFLETAHPAKFKEVVDETLGSSVPIPEKLKTFIAGTKKCIPMHSDFNQLKDWLLQSARS
jgi:threonine synthase